MAKRGMKSTPVTTDDGDPTLERPLKCRWKKQISKATTVVGMTAASSKTAAAEADTITDTVAPAAENHRGKKTSVALATETT